MWRKNKFNTNDFNSYLEAKADKSHGNFAQYFKLIVVLNISLKQFSQADMLHIYKNVEH